MTTQIRIDGQVLDGEAFLLCRHDRRFTLTHRDVCRWLFVTVPSTLAGTLHIDRAGERTRRASWLQRLRTL